MGGHGGLNILPQKRWNVYRQDNREKVSSDQKLLQSAKDKVSKLDAQQGLQSMVTQLRTGTLSKEEEKVPQKSDQEIFKKAQWEVKQREWADKQGMKQEFLTVAKKGMEEGRQHINLFRAEQLNEVIKQKKLEETGEVQGKEDYLNKSGLLGDLMKEHQKPWYVKQILADDKP